MVWIYGYGWPPQTGGPMFWADTLGLGHVVARLEAHAKALGPDVATSALLRDKAARGERLSG